MSNTQDPIKLLDEYAEARHVHGDYTYNAVTKAARDRAIAALQSPAPQPKVVDPETSRAIDEAVKAGRIVFEPGWNAQPPGDAREPAEADFVKWRDDYGLRSEPNWSEHTEMDCAAAFAAGAAWQAATAQASEPSMPAAEVRESAPINPAGNTVKAAYLIDKTLPAGTLLYPAAPARAVKQLTTGQILDMARCTVLSSPFNAYIKGIRDAEEFHGIPATPAAKEQS